MIHINGYKLTPAITATWGDITGNVSNQEDLVEYISTHGGGNAAWGSISGNISDQVDLQNTLGSYATQDWISSQQFVTESWVSEQGYLYSSNTSGDKVMNFNTNIPSIHLRNTVSSQLTINPWMISMYGSSHGTLITPNTVGTIMGDASSYKTAGAICDVDLSSAVLVVRDVGDTNDYLKIDCHNIYTYSGGISVTYPLSEFASKGDLSGYATESWVSSQQFATQSWVSGQGYLRQVPPFYATQMWVQGQGYITSSALTGYATESWVSSQGYVNNSQVVSIFNDCNPLVYDMSNPLVTYLESHSVLKYDDVPEPEEEGEGSPTNPLVLGYTKFYRPSYASEVTSNTLEVEGTDLLMRTYNVSFDSSTGQVTSMEKVGEMTPCWLGPNEWPLMFQYPEEETGSPTDQGIVKTDDYDYGVLIGVEIGGDGGNFEGLRVTGEGVPGKYVVTGEEDEETGEMTYTEEFYPFVYGEETGRVIDEFGGIYIKGNSVEIGIDEDTNSSGLRIYDSGQGAEIVKYRIIDDGRGNLTTSEQILATQDWVTEQITNSIGSAMSITNQILS